METPMQLRVIVSKHGELWEARLVELSLAVQSNSQEGLRDEITHALTVEYRTARHYGMTPFVNCVRPRDSKVAKEWDESKATDWGILILDEEVIDALAMVLHAPIAKFTMRELRMAA